MLLGGMVLVGWAFPSSEDLFLLSILDGAVTMKVTTALAFLLCGLVTFLMTIKRTGWTDTMIAAFSMQVLFIMGLMVFWNLTGIHLGLGTLIAEEAEGTPFTDIPGRPSMGTMIGFITIAAHGMMHVGLDAKAANLVRRIVSMIVIGLGSVAMVGYLFSEPGLFYYIQGYSTAMAVHTAGAFVALGFAMMFLGKDISDVSAGS